MNKIKSRHIWILVVLLTLLTGRALGQIQPGSNIVLRTMLSSDCTASVNQRDSNNNPQTIYFTNGNEIRYIYSGTGEKLCAKYYNAVPNVTRAFGVKPEGYPQSQIMCVYQYDYILGGSMVMYNGMIDKVLFDGGYAKGTPFSSTGYGFTLYYYNKDHLGNNREVVNYSGNVQQLTNYYPFGAPYTDPNAVMGSTVQPYKYNGKELVTMHGLNTYDYGARQYDPILCRWDRVDPLAEKYYSISPYAYCANNPVNAIDPDGQYVRIIFDKSKNQLQIMDMDYFKKGAKFQYVTAGEYERGRFNQVLVINNVFSGGIVDDESGNIVRDPNRSKERPIPNGVYDILDNKSTKAHQEWFRLDKQDDNRYDDKDDETGRGQFRLHLGRESWGCITISNNQENSTEIWNALSDILNNTSVETVKDNGSWNPIKTLIKYGILSVIGEDKIPIKGKE